MMQPGLEVEMRRARQKATRFPGVWWVDGNSYRVRAKTQDPKTGKQREIDRVVEAANAAEAHRTRDLLLAQSAEPVQERMRLRTYATSWLSGRRKTLKASTRSRYATTLEMHVLPKLGEHYIDAITHQDIVTWRDAQEGEPSTINSRLRVLKTLLASATIDLDLPRDPAHRVQSIREFTVDDEPNCLTAAELDTFLEAARAVTPRWYPLFATLALTAMRVGEATALRWDDIDEHAGLIRVRRSHWRGIVDTTKTNTKRTVPLPDKLATILRDHRRALVARQAKGLEEGWVFPGRHGKPIGHTTPRKPFLAALAAAKLQHLTVHGLRRTWNNLLRQVTAGEVVRSITGHVTERMTEHYSHIAHSEKAHAATKALLLVSATRVGTSVGTAAPETKKAGEESL